MPIGGARPAPRTRFYVLGDVMLDVVVEARASFAHASDTPSAIATSPGGSGANQAAAMARAGAVVTMLGAVGDDPFGDAATRALEAAGVDVGLLARTRRPTGVVVALVDRDGQRSMLTDRGANLALDVGMLERLGTVLDEHSHVHVSGYYLLDDASRPAARRALELAARHGASTSVDASSAGPLRAVGAVRFLSWVSGVDFLFCNEEEGRVLAAPNEPATMARSLTTAVGEVIMTVGAAGALVATRAGELWRRPAADAGRVADTIGAGDSATAAYLVRRLEGGGIAEALDAAVREAGRAVARHGARDWARYSRE